MLIKLLVATTRGKLNGYARYAIGFLETPHSALGYVKRTKKKSFVK